MFLALFEWALFAGFIWFVVTQVIIPVITRTKMFPAFRKGRKAILEDMITNEKDHVEEKVLRNEFDNIKKENN